VDRGEHSGNRKLFLKFCHGGDNVSIHSLDVAPHRNRYAGVTQNPLNYPIWDSQSMQISRKTPTRGVKSVPLEAV
jgi:hypothetical protein